MVGATIVFLETPLHLSVVDPTVIAERGDLARELQLEVCRASAQQCRS
jgi:hypothetical protein